MNLKDAFFAAVVTMGVAAGAAQGQTYPSKPITIFIGNVPGGAMDVLARAIGLHLTKRWGQNVLVESRPGAGGNIAYSAVAHSAPDGYTLAMGSPPFASSFFIKNMPFDPITDLTPASIVGRSYYPLLVSRGMNVRTLKEFVAYAKANAGKVSIGMVPAGPNEVETNAMLAALDISANLIPYKGTAPVWQALMSNEANAALMPAPPQLKTGEIVAVAFGGEKRISEYPDVPTFREQGVAYDPQAVYILLAPSATPPAILNRIAGEVAVLVKSEEFATRVKSLGIEGVGSKPEFAASFLRDEYTRMKNAADRAGIKPR